MINCILCGELICKYVKDFKVSGALSVQVGKNLECKDICHDCAKTIAEEVLDEF